MRRSLLFFFVVLPIANVFGQSVPLPMANLQLRYVAPLPNNDTMSLYLYLQDSADWCVTSLQVRFDTTVHRRKRYFDDEFGDILSSDACLKPGRLLTLTSSIYDGNGKPTYDTVFVGQFDSNFQTLKGTIRLKGQRGKLVVLRKDKHYVDTEGLMVDSLLKRFQVALARDDRAVVADYFDYPLTINTSRTVRNRVFTQTRKIRSKRALLRSYARVFSESVKKELLSLYGPIWYGGEATGEAWVISHGEQWETSGGSIYASASEEKRALFIDEINIER